MSEGTDYEFEWDNAKAESNLAKHGVDFMDAMSVLLDPLAMTRTMRMKNAGSVWDAPQTDSCCWSSIPSAPPGRTRRWCD